MNYQHLIYLFKLFSNFLFIEVYIGFRAATFIFFLPLPFEYHGAVRGPTRNNYLKVSILAAYVNDLGRKS